MSVYKISLDAMSGDHGAPVVVEAALAALKEFSDIALTLVGDEAILRAELQKHPAVESDRLSIHHASEVVAMDEAPALALKRKKDSSMRVSINLVKSGAVDACVCAGNTGALMATAKFVLKTLPGISRPAITTSLPSLRGHTHVLDLGANIDSSAAQLYQFAVMGAALVGALEDKQTPCIGLLNVGAEALKGSAVVKEAGKLLTDSSLNYQGFVEGDDIFTGDVDVIVCDGFVGNVALKTSEGLAKMISTNLKAGFKKSWFTMMAGIVAMPVLRAFRKSIDPRRYNGASLLGLNGIVVKSHGGADALAFANAIKIARIEAEQNVPQQISALLSQVLVEK
ncbi:MAG: phosphate acyltransferase PlsX [bacterium]